MMSRFIADRTRGFKVPLLIFLMIPLLNLGVSATAVGATTIDFDLEERIKGAIVKIYTVTNRPDYFRPWNTITERVSGSGCVIKGNKILTNAHVVADHTFIEVRRFGQPKRYKADVLNVSHEADLALLSVKEEAFFKDVIPLGLTELPRMQQEVVVYGFPMGGDTLSVTKGIVSRIEHLRYTHSSEYLLAIQIDAALNAGNSGGPVLSEGKIIGVVMQKVGGAENIGYVVPTPIILHFFHDIEDGRYDGFPGIGLVTQKMENPSMKEKYKMPESETGMLVRHVLPESPAKGFIRSGDVILSIDGHDIADDGTVEFRQKERTSSKYFVDLHQIGDKLRVELLRDSRSEVVELALGEKPNAFRTVAMEEYDQLPRYLIYGGIVFCPLSKNLLKTLGRNAPKNLLEAMSRWPTEAKREIIIVQQVLASDVNKGYHDVYGWIVEEVNGNKFKNFKEFWELILKSDEPYLVFESEKGFQIVINRKKAEESHGEILKRYRINMDRSIGSQ
jgi:S1-C subfamily serine protease